MSIAKTFRFTVTHSLEELSKAESFSGEFEAAEDIISREQYTNYLQTIYNYNRKHLKTSETCSQLTYCYQNSLP